jgi:hypothetical protein
MHRKGETQAAMISTDVREPWTNGAGTQLAQVASVLLTKGFPMLQHACRLMMMCAIAMAACATSPADRGDSTSPDGDPAVTLASTSSAVEAGPITSSFVCTCTYQCTTTGRLFDGGSKHPAQACVIARTACQAAGCGQSCVQVDLECP